VRAPNLVLDELDELAGYLATKPLDDIRFYSQLVRDTDSHLDKVRRGT
jgi:hypothetical protein